MTNSDDLPDHPPAPPAQDPGLNRAAGPMTVLIAGGHGKIARRLGRLLAARGDHPVGLIRDPGQSEDLRADGIEPVVLDLEHTHTNQIAERFAEVGGNAVVFAAGAGPGSGPERKQTVDRGAAVVTASAAEFAGIRRYVQISSVGVESVRDGGRPDGIDDTFLAYLRAKLAAEDDLRARALDWTIVRPGPLTDDPGTGSIQLLGAVADVPRAPVSRDDIAALLAETLGRSDTGGMILTAVGGDVPVRQALETLVANVAG